MSITQQAFVQYAGMAVAFVLGWLAHRPVKDPEVANCAHHGWDEMRGQAVSWLHEAELNGRPRMVCSYCGKAFPGRSSAMPGRATGS